MYKMKRVGTLALSLLLAAGLISGCSAIEKLKGDLDETDTTTAESSGEETEETATERETVDVDTLPDDGPWSDYISIGDYNGLTFSAEDLAVSDEDVMLMVKYNLYSAGMDMLDVTDRAAELGDVVTMDYVGTIDGEEFDGGSATDAILFLGSDTYIDGFEEGLVGATIGEEVVLNLTFPEDYSTTDLAGKDCQFTVTISAISEADVSDDAISELSGEVYTTADAYIAHIRSNEEKDVRDALLWEALEGITEVKSYPEKTLTDLLQSEIAYYDSVASGYFGMTLEELVSSYYGYTFEEFEAEVQSSIEAYLLRTLIAEAIIDQEGISLSDEELTEVQESIASYYGYSSVDALIEAYDEESLQEAVNMDIALSYVMDHAAIEE